jgi:predicted PurR-regulated permease PerM
VSIENVLGLEERDDTEVREPDLQETASALEQRQGLRSFALTGLLLLACLYTFYLAQGFLAPLVMAIVFNFFLSPFVRALGKLHVPEALGALVVMLAGVCLVGLLIYQFSGPVSDWIERAPGIMGKISADLQRIKKPVETVSRATEQVSNMTQVAASDTTKKPPAQVELKRPGVLDGLFSKTRDAVLGLVVFLVMLYFLLSSGDLFLRKLIHVLPRLRDKKRAVLIMRQIEDHISKYLITVAMINACLGTAGGLAFWALGMPNPALWGALAFVLNFIPYLGALTELVIVGLVAAATFPHLTHALLVPACYLGLATIEANLLTPYVMGRRMTLNPVVIFVAVTFWGFLWGILGIFLAVPALVMLKIFCDHIGPLAPIGEFLGS